MAQLVWRPVEAPQGTTRDIAVAGQTIGNSFDRMGQMLKDREANLRKQATGDATAEAYMASTPEEIAAIRARGFGNLDKRVDKSAFAQSLGAAETDMLARTKTREEVLNIQAASQLGDEGAMYLGMLNEGKRDEAMKFAAGMAQQQPDLWGRVAYGYAKDGEDLFSGWSERKETNRSNMRGEALTEQGQQLNYKVGMAGVAAQNARTQLERERMTQADAEKRQREEDIRFGRTFSGEFTSRARAEASTEDVTQELIRSPTFKALSTSRQDAVLAGLKDPTFGRDARLTPTETQLEGIQPYTNSLTSLTDTAQRIRDASLNRFDAANRPSAVIRAAAVMKDVTPEQVYAAAKPRGISDADIERVRAQNPGVGYNHILAAIKNDGSITDSNFFSRKVWGQDGRAQFHGGEMALESVVKKVDDLLLNQGDLARTEGERAKKEAPAANLLKEAARLETQLARVRASGGDTSVFAARIAALEKRANALQATMVPTEK